MEFLKIVLSYIKLQIATDQLKRLYHAEIVSNRGQTRMALT